VWEVFERLQSDCLVDFSVQSQFSVGQPKGLD
jgi:hypothetical protein